MKKKIVAIFMATILSVSLVACSTGNSTADTKQEAETSVSATDKKDNTKKEDYKKKDSDKEKSESKKTESEKKESDKKKEDDTVKESAKKEEKTDDKKETAKADTGNKDNSTQKPNTNNNSSTKPSNNNNSNNKPSTPSKPTPPAEQPSKPENKPSNPTPEPPAEKPNTPDSGNNGNHNGHDKPAHKHNYKVVSSTNGDCSHAGTVTKQCSCGATVTETGSYGNHNWQDQYKDVPHDAEYEERPVYKWVAYYQCKKCGSRFNDVEQCGEHCLYDCDSTYTTKKEQVQTGTESVKVKDAWTERVLNGKKCTICGTTHQ